MSDLFVSTLKEALERQLCPLCGSSDVQRMHHQGDTLAPECDYLECGSCEHQWGHE